MITPVRRPTVLGNVVANRAVAPYLGPHRVVLASATPYCLQPEDRISALAAIGAPVVVDGEATVLGQGSLERVGVLAILARNATATALAVAF